MTKILIIFILLLTTCAAMATPQMHRIISTDAAVTDLLFDFNLQDHLVAIDVTSQLPEGFRKTPNIGYHRNLSAEGLLSLNPSIIIGSELMGPNKVIQTLTQAKVNFLQLPMAKTSAALQHNINQVATKLQQQTKADALNKEIDAKVTYLKAHALKNERIAFLLSMDPNKLRLAGKNTNGSALIKLLGAKNISTFENYRNVSAESLLAMNPTTLIVAGRSDMSVVDELLEAQNVLRYSTAGKHNKIISIDGRVLVSGLSVAAIDEALRISKQLNTQQETD